MKASFRWTVILIAICVGGMVSGCQSCNNNEDNKRIWYPNILKPNYLNQDVQHLYPEGGASPYPDPELGPRSLQVHGDGFDSARNWTTQTLNNAKADITTTSNVSSSVVP